MSNEYSVHSTEEVILPWSLLHPSSSPSNDVDFHVQIYKPTTDESSSLSYEMVSSVTSLCKRWLILTNIDFFLKQKQKQKLEHQQEAVTAVKNDNRPQVSSITAPTKAMLITDDVQRK
jgi:hypothetical protein